MCLQAIDTGGRVVSAQKWCRSGYHFVRNSRYFTPSHRTLTYVRITLGADCTPSEGRTCCAWTHAKANTGKPSSSDVVHGDARTAGDRSGGRHDFENDSTRNQAFPPDPAPIDSPPPYSERPQQPTIRKGGVRTYPRSAKAVYSAPCHRTTAGRHEVSSAPPEGARVNVKRNSTILSNLDQGANSPPLKQLVRTAFEDGRHVSYHS